MKTGLESLDTGAPEITYSGNQGPKSPQEDQQKMQEFQMAQLEEEYGAYVDDMIEQGIEPMSMQQFLEQIKAEAQMSSQPQGIENMMQEPREMAAFGGIMGLDGRKEYGGGSDLGKRSRGYQGEKSVTSSRTSKSPSQDTSTAQDNRGNRTEQDKTPAQQFITNPATGKQETFNLTGNNNQSEQAAIAFALANQGKADAPFQFPDFKTAASKGINFFKKSYYNRFPNNPEMEFRFINQLDEEEFDDLPQSLKDAFKKTKTRSALRSGKTYKDFDKLSFEDFNVLANNPDFQKYAKDRGSPTLSVSGDMSKLGDKFVKRDPITKEAIRDPKTGQILYGYNDVRGEGEGSNQQILPMTTGMTTGADTDVASVIPYRGDQFLRADNQALLADGGRIGYADGGITDLRQGYFLGKLVKKATRAVKKIAKSPIGMAALGYLGTAGLNSIGSGTTGFGRFSGANFMGGLNKATNFLFKGGGKDKMYDGKFNPFKVGIGGLSLATYLMAKNSEDDEPSLDEYMRTASRGPSINPMGIRQQIAANKGNINPMDYAFLNPDYYQTAADGGRIDYADGGIGKLRGALSNEQFGYDEDDDDIKKLAMGGSAGMPPVTMMSDGQNIQSFGDDESMPMAQGTTLPNQMPIPKPMIDPRMMQQMMMASKMNPQMGGRMMAAMGGRMGYAEGGESELLDMGGMEKDYRNDGGFVPMGEYERKDDVPARLSKNEFVFTADAVRNAGGGDIDKGAKIMENMMTNLENGGKVSQGSQGLDGAREMFQTQQRLGEVL